MTGHTTTARTGTAAGSSERAEQIGTRLRRIRQQQGLSLADVEQRSGGTWKAVVVGAYERGDRAVTISRLADLAGFYRVPLRDLLPEPRRIEPSQEPGQLVLDLTRLDETAAGAIGAVARFAARVRSQRGDHNGRVLSLRGQDLATIALATGADPMELRRALDREGLLLTA